MIINQIYAVFRQNRTTVSQCQRFKYFISYYWLCQSQTVSINKRFYRITKQINNFLKFSSSKLSHWRHIAVNKQLFPSVSESTPLFETQRPEYPSSNTVYYNSTKFSYISILERNPDGDFKSVLSDDVITDQISCGLLHLF